MAELTINNWQQGIGTSPYTGFAQMTNVDIYSKVGSLKISHNLVVDSNSASVVDGLIKWGVQDPNSAAGDAYFVDDNGKVYLRGAGSSVWSVITGHGSAGQHGEGLSIWKHYLFLARATKLDVYALPSSPNGDAGTWYNDWQTLESSSSYNLHPMMAAQDDILYIGDKNFVSTIEEVAFQVFDPGNMATFTPNLQDLELRQDYRVVCLEEQGSQIVIGTLVGANNNMNIADVFIWDGTSDSFSLNGTVHLVETGVKMMKNVNNTIYAIAGNEVPRVFNFVTSQSQEVKRFNNIDVPYGNTTTPRQGAIEYKEGEILFGISSSSNNVSPIGVYALKNGAYVLRYLISTGSDSNIRIGLVKAIGRDNLLVSWRDAGVFGVDSTTGNFYTGYTAYVDSAIYQTGTDDDPVTFEKCEIRMGKALKAGDKVKIQARYDLDGAYVDICKFDTTAVPGLIGRSVIDQKVTNIGEFKDIQLKIQLDVDPNSTESPELMSVSLK